MRDKDTELRTYARFDLLGVASRDGDKHCRTRELSIFDREQ